MQEQEYILTADTLAQPDYLKELTVSSFYRDSILSSTEVPDTVIPQLFPGTDISGKPVEMDIVFLFFLVCFLMTSHAFARGRQMISSMFNNLFHIKSRQSIFIETTGNDMFDKSLLVTQSIILSAILMYIWFMHGGSYEPSGLKSMTHIICLSGLIGIYILYKFLVYRLISYVFFDRSLAKIWIDSWVSLISFHGLIIFLPVLCQFYIPSLYYFNFWIIILWFFVTRIIIIYKSYVIFFSNIGSLHYLFLYLCAQEIVPLFLLYNGMIFIFNVLETSAL